MDDLKIALPCGFTTKLIKVEMEKDKFKCPVCKNHEISRQECMKITRNKLVIGQASLEMKLEKLSDCEKNLQIFYNNPEYFLEESVAEVKNKIDLRREELKLIISQKIDSYYENLLDHIEKQKKVKLDEFKKNTEKIFSSEKIKHDFKLLEEADIKSKLEFIENQSDKIENEIDFIKTTIAGLTDMNFVSNDQEIDVENLFGKINFGSKSVDKILSDKGTFNLVINDMSKIRHKKKLKLFSKPYTMKNLEWIIKVALSENDLGQIVLGLHLYCRSAFESSNLSVYADSELRVLHNTLPEKSIGIRNKKYFEKTNFSYGTNELIRLSELLDPKNGFYDVKNDSITIEGIIKIDDKKSANNLDEKNFTKIKLCHGKEKYSYVYRNGFSETVQQSISSI